jgi:GNAT superfamily N-acetyltransferase
MTTLRPFEPGDVDFALRQKAREGWAVSREQFVLYLEHDPDGCFVATEGGRPVGMVTTTWFGPSGWIGNLIVEPPFRGRGIGRALMEHGLDHLRKRGAKTVRLEADPPGIPLYRKLGFVDEVESCRYVLPAARAPGTLEDEAAEPMGPGDLDEVAALDGAIVGEDRGRFLELKRRAARLAVVRRRDGRVVASLMASPSDRGLRLAPCVALDAADARALIESAVATAAGQPVLAGLPAVNTAGIELLAAMGFEPRPSSFRMRLGPPLRADPARIYGIASGAVG